MPDSPVGLPVHNFATLLQLAGVASKAYGARQPGEIRVYLHLPALEVAR
jgi:hypothetical protein